MSVKSEVIEGAAEILWAVNWADHAEEHGCTRLSGTQIESVMPSIPKEAYALAKKVIAGFERANGVTIDKLFERAIAADKAEGQDTPDPLAFGNDLAHMSMGSGVSWFDDHANFPLKTSREAEHEGYHLHILADTKCKKKGRPACPECSSYNPEGKKTCANCGEKL